MILIVGELVFHQLISPRLAVVWEIEEVDYVVFLLLDYLPAVIDDLVKSEGFMIGLPAGSNKNWICSWERDKLEL